MLKRRVKAVLKVIARGAAKNAGAGNPLAVKQGLSWTASISSIKPLFISFKLIVPVNLA